MITTLIILIVYIASALYNHRWIQKAHSEGGIYYGLTPDSADGFLTLFPVVNTLFAMVHIFASPLKNKEINWKKFFNVDN